MTPGQFVKDHQQLWARRKGLRVDANGYFSTGEGDSNLFEALSPEVRASFNKADGNELKPKGNGLPKMNALHSSSALAVNVFHYWRARDKTLLAQAMDIPSRNIESIEFEALRPIASQVDRKAFPKDPNVDVVFRYASAPVSEVGIESKFGEACGRHKGLREAYFRNDSLWIGLEHCRQLAETVREKPCDGLDISQLLKHTLGLKQSSCGKVVWLSYVWFATPGPELGQHFQQLDQFKETLQEDGIRFVFQTYQELIVRLSRTVTDADAAYIDYLADRYL